MKNLFLLTIGLVFINLSQTFSQNDLNYNNLQYNEPRSMYVGSPTEELKRSGEAATNAYANNKKYRDDLIDWIFDLKKKSDDTQFLNALDSYYNQLKAMDGGTFEYFKSKLDQIKLNIKEEIDKYNTRKKEAPKRLWETGNDYLKNKDYVNAITDYTSLIAIAPDYPPVYKNRGYAYQCLKNYSSALSDLNKYIAINTSDPFAYSARGWAKYGLNDNMGALADFNKQIELEPSAQAYYARGAAKSELNDYYGAIEDYSKAVALKPDFSMAYNNIAWVKFLQKDYKSGFEDANKAIDLDQSNSNAYDTRGCLYFGLMNYSSAIKDFNKAIGLDSRYSNSYLYRGRCNFKTGRKKEACEDWSKAGELGKTDAYDFISKYCK